MPPSIYEYVLKEKNNFETGEIQLGDNWYWNFKKHVQLIFHLKNGVFFTGDNDYMRAFRNIMLPILNLSYWTEDIEVKDVVFYIENKLGKVLSFLLKKYHDEVYVKEHDLDKLFDEITESDLDYGGALVQKGEKRPEIIILNSISFCDQTDIMGGPIGFEFSFSPSKLRSMSKFGWGDVKNGATHTVEELITLADNQKTAKTTKSSPKNKVTGKNIEIQIVHGDLPKAYLDDSNDMEDYVNQTQIIAFYTDKDNNKQGVTLFRKEKTDESILFHTSKEIYGRALGQGVGETLIHPQIWTNFLTIHKTALLEASSKVPLYTDDPSYTTKNKIQDMENLEITTIEDGKRIYQVPTGAPANINTLQNSVNEWFTHAQISGAANDPILGVEQASGTTFRGQERVVAQGRGLHDRRRGQRAKFIEKIYRDWIIPDMVKEITNGKTFMATLSTDELSWVADQLSSRLSNKQIFDKIVGMNLEDITQEKIKALQEIPKLVKKNFIKNGNKHLIEILKDEFKDIEIKVGVNVAGKQKNLANLSDKILSVFQFIFSNPQGFQQAMQIPALASAFEDILEFSSLSVADFHTLISPVDTASQLPEQNTQTANQPSNQATIQPNMMETAQAQ